MSAYRRVLVDWADGLATWVLLDEAGRHAGTEVGDAPEPPPAELRRARLLARAREAIDADRAYLDIGQPTQAQAVAQVRALTRQTAALLRLAAGLLDADD